MIIQIIHVNSEKLGLIISKQISLPWKSNPGSYTRDKYLTTEPHP